ncbi:ATP-dependent Clp protease ATP-binding subunit ClpX [Candidatus Nasuia deltocephalinicola]|nr:ATP-dependent Clp protease ATP-binding subunit ClpX [Candidatus Nasuia deltocephalinicola]
MNYIYIDNLEYNKDNFLISNEFCFICTNCLKLCNKIFFLNNYIFYKKNNIIINEIDDYSYYLYCYISCINCYLYFENYYRYYANPNYIHCEFEKDYFYYDIINDYYDYYKYCENINCFCCLKYFKLIKNCYCFNEVFIRNYNKEFNITYNFYKSENFYLDLINPQEIYDFLDKFIVGQKIPKKLISVSIYNHYKKIKLNLDFNFNLSKNNILMIGPSGSGKTFLIKTLSKILDIPMVIIDATKLTETGYVGEDVDSIIQKLFNESFYDEDLTELGIVFIDEIDKISSKNISNSSNRDISGEGVQQALLKLIENTYCTVSAFNDDGEQFFFEINTENILFICGGAFPGIDNFYKDYNFDLYDEIINRFFIFDTQKLVDFGLIPELIGRLSLIIKFENLNVNFLENILSNVENSLISYYNNLFILENVTLKLIGNSKHIISDLAFKKNLGSRGLKSILDNILLDIMYKLPSLDSLNEIIIHSKIFEKNSNGPLLKYDF